MLIKRGIISLPELKSLEELSIESGESIKDILFKENRLDENQLVDILSEQYNVPKIDLSELEIQPEVIALLNEQIVTRYNVIPISRIGNTLTVAMADPSNMNAQDDIKFLTDYNVEVVIASSSDIEAAITKYYGEQAKKDDKKYGDISFDMEALLSEADDVKLSETNFDESTSLEDMIRNSEEAPVIRFVNMVLLDAIKKKASDIHVEPYEKSFRIRLRMDGVLYDVVHPPRNTMDAIVARLK
ncbi:type II secretion system protein GspE, partial [bacterium]|nr:type II secretion system protein GspE [bacterium]